MSLRSLPLEDWAAKPAERVCEGAFYACVSIKERFAIVLMYTHSNPLKDGEPEPEHLQQKVLQLFRAVAELVPAFKTLLEEEGVSPLDIVSISDFRTLVPLVDKANYLHKYPLPQRCIGGDICVCVRVCVCVFVFMFMYVMPEHMSICTHAWVFLNHDAPSLSLSLSLSLPGAICVGDIDFCHVSSGMCLFQC